MAILWPRDVSFMMYIVSVFSNKKTCSIRNTSIVEGFLEVWDKWEFLLLKRRPL